MQNSPSPWSPLRQNVFRTIWIATVVSNVGTWMQSVGVGWLMTTLTPSPLLVALMQTAASLPIFLLGLPAGTFSDILDRRKLLLLTEAWLLLVALTLGILTLTGHMTTWLLLLLTFLMGLGSAFDAPAWQAIVPDLVEREDLPAAVALNATGFNVARALGPALGGIIIALSGPAAVFILNAVSFIFVLVAIYRWRRAPMASGPHPEDMLGATTAGLRYVRHAPALQAVLIRVGAFAMGGSALWALLPVMARHELNLDATGYGIVLGSLGVGGVTGALLMPRLRRILSVDGLANLATLVFAAATLALAYVHFLPLLVLAMIAGGMAWLTILSNLTVAATTASPAWVRARTLGIYLLVFQGLMALGSLGWGLLAEQVGSATTLSVAAVALVCGLATALRWPLSAIQHIDVSPSGHWNDPKLLVTPDPEDGPVLITVEYHVPSNRAGEFIQAMDEMRIFRRREGAVRWNIFRDLESPDRYIETFLVLTWAEHMRQHARVTVADQELEKRVFAFLQPGATVVATHLIAARTYDEDAPPYVELS